MDTNLFQINKGLNVFRPSFESLIQLDGCIVLVGACPEGRGYHYFCDYQLPLWRTIKKNNHIIISNLKCGYTSINMLKDIETNPTIYSNNKVILNYRDIYRRNISVFLNWCISRYELRINGGHVFENIKLLDECNSPTSQPPIVDYIDSLPNKYTRHMERTTDGKTASYDYTFTKEN